MDKELLKATLSTMPESPGCYQYFDEDDRIIYVGKAKNLKRRVSSYFNKDLPDRKTRILVRQIRSIKYFVVESEADALLLENNLIKNFKPRYNIMLKDSKSYPSIVLKHEFFPRVYMTRDLRDTHSEYFGPFPSILVAKNMIALIRELYPLRTCKHDLNLEKIARKSYKVCLQYHIKLCKGPCAGHQSEQDYMQSIDEVRTLLRGNLKELIDRNKEAMMQASSELRYEEAAAFKERLDLLLRYEHKHTVVPSKIDNVDVFSYEEDETHAYVNYLHVERGGINKISTVEYKKLLDESREELFATAITELRELYRSTAQEIILPFDTGWQNTEKYTLTIPQRGDKRKLLDLSIKNVKQYKLDKMLRAQKLNPEQRALRVLKKLQDDLHLQKAPQHIECFDNSNIQGTNPVAACVVFKKAKPSKKDYRKFHVKTVEGPNDYDSMREILHRRYQRFLQEETPLPDLIVVDGGKGQLSVAYETLDALGILGKVSLIGLAERLEEVYFPHDSVPLILDKNSESLKLLQHMRDEAHRFGLKFHRDLRSKAQTKSELDTIKGIGPKTKEELLKHFKSMKRIKEAKREELVSVVGYAKAAILLGHFEQNNQNETINSKG